MTLLLVSTAHFQFFRKDFNHYFIIKSLIARSAHFETVNEYLKVIFLNFDLSDVKSYSIN